MKFFCLLIAYGASILLFNCALAQESLTLRKIKETGIITIGFRVESIPFSYLDHQQRPIGYSIDLCNKIVDAVKTKLNLESLEIKYKPVISSNRSPLISNDIVDLDS
jgi:glutamate/aspartate transport system substrate-binding protein